MPDGSVSTLPASRETRRPVCGLVSSGPGDTNEETAEVKIQEEHFTGTELTLAPCSMAVLEWQE